MELRLARTDRHQTRTVGQLFVNDKWECYTLEDAVRDDPNPVTPENEAKVPGRTAIPLGQYQVVAALSPKFGPNTLTLLNVPGFTYIRIHAGNRDTDTEGCLLVGQTLEDWDGEPGPDAIGRSKAALAALKAKVLPVLARESCWLTVEEEF